MYKQHFPCRFLAKVVSCIMPESICIGVHILSVCYANTAVTFKLSKQMVFAPCTLYNLVLVWMVGFNTGMNLLLKALSFNHAAFAQ